MRRLLILTAALLALPAASAHAALFPGDPVDGPTPGSDVQSLGDLDLARDGSGALTYVKTIEGSDRIFVARFAGGVFAAGEQIDAGLPGISSQPVVAAADAERLVAVFVNGGTVYGVVRPSGVGFQAPVVLGPGSDPSVDMSINGTAYASFTSGGDVRIARLDRRSNAWGLLEQPADVDPGRTAGVGTGRSRVAISADGIGVVTWGEAGHVYARKMFAGALSTAPQDLSPATLDGFAAPTVSELPDIDAEDDSSFAWVVFRQAFADGRVAILGARQRGTGFDPAAAVISNDGGPLGEPGFDMNARGVGLATAAGLSNGQPIVSILDKDLFGPAGGLFDSSVVAPAVAPAMSDNNDGFVASVLSAAGEPPSVHVYTYDDRRPAKEFVISRPELGPVDPARGFKVATDRASGAVIAWVQGGPGERRIIAGYNDREPGTFTGFTAARCCQPALARLSWSASFSLWGALKYQVRMDGQLVGETTDTKIVLATALQGPLHHWQVTAIDVRGQTRRMRTRLLRVDSIAPRVSVGYKRKKRVVNVSVRGSDVGGAGTRASGIRSVTIQWGDGSQGVSEGARFKARHVYPRPGTYVLQVTARDRAGNATVNNRNVVVG